MARLSAGAASGRAATAGKALDKLNSDQVKVKKPFVPKKRTFTFPDVERMGQTAVKVKGLTHGCALLHLCFSPNNACAQCRGKPRVELKSA